MSISTPVTTSHAMASCIDHDLTLVIPAFNEEFRLPRSLSAAKRFLDQWGIDYRVIVVDNGSRDRTGLIASEFGGRFSTIRQNVPGKGAAVRMGLLASRGRVAAFTDADLPFDLSCLRTAYEEITSGACSVVLGSRYMFDSPKAAHRDPLRSMASRVFRKIVAHLVPCSVSDTQCGLKAFSRSAAQRIFTRATIDSFAFDAEVIFIAEHLGLSCHQVPVHLVNDYASTVSLTRHAGPMLRDLLRIRWNAIRHVYNFSEHCGDAHSEMPITHSPQVA